MVALGHIHSGREAPLRSEPGRRERNRGWREGDEGRDEGEGSAPRGPRSGIPLWSSQCCRLHSLLLSTWSMVSKTIAERILRSLHNPVLYCYRQLLCPVGRSTKIPILRNAKQGK
uniref:Uncharacterized protein LOC105050673 n=1 Tax=Elaeis guineensis var. tenera TaxID=51953 RepID=A0A8N4F2J0_ELAGV|nr:uncharacterized protein LOC105050673 [Elaeis guineensis]